MIDVDFTGSESPADIVKAAIDEFARHPHPSDFSIFYENSIPKMRYRFQVADVEFSCTYRLDAMLAPFYAEAEQIFDELAELKAIEVSLRQYLVPYIAFTGMTNMLSRLLILQLEIFRENFAEARITARSIFLHSLVKQTGSPNKALLARGVSKIVQRWIDEDVATSMKRKRDFLVGFINTQPLLQIPTSAGRPPGTKKSEKKRAQDKREFEAKIEERIRALYAATGTFPTKTAVAESLSSGPNALRVFIAKTKGLKIDYEALAKRVKDSLIN
jgi:hypothetical protein